MAAGIGCSYGPGKGCRHVCFLIEEYENSGKDSNQYLYFIVILATYELVDAIAKLSLFECQNLTKEEGVQESLSRATCTKPGICFVRQPLRSWLSRALCVREDGRVPVTNSAL